MKNIKFSKSNHFYRKALKYIPLASQTFSKSAMNFVKGATPLFIDKGKGAYTWDVDNNKFIDYILGLLPIVLGHCDPDVDQSIRKQLKKGISFSLSSELEYILAQKLTKIIPSAEKVRFGKNGSDVTSAAIRLARAYTKRDKIALCGYHGWHDWYIGTTARDLGVPEVEKSLVSTFKFNDLESLERILFKEKFAAVILEPAGSIEPNKDYLSDLKKITHKHGALLIFDEIVTGFRVDLGGAQKYYGVTPDLSCFGKAMGNGMPIAALVGRKSIMELIEDIFYSGTFAGETLSLAASITTIEKIKTESVDKKIKKTGDLLIKEINKKIHKKKLQEYLKLSGPVWRPLIKINDKKLKKKNLLKSLIKQELIAEGLLISSAINLCLSHSDNVIVNKTLNCWEKSLNSLKKYMDSTHPEKYLRGSLVEPIFKVRKI